MDYRQLQPQPDDNVMMSSARGMARLNGSNRAAWNAMDLQIGAQVPPPNARGSSVEDCGALSARNVLLRQKLRERKRYDSADDAMKKAAARAANRAGATLETQKTTPTQPPTQTQSVPPLQFSPAQMGQSAFFNAMDNAKPRNVHRNAPTIRYETSGGAEQGRHVLIQRKLQNKTAVECLDSQTTTTARYRQAAQAQLEDTPMEDVSEARGGNDDPVSSPCASSAELVSRRQHVASMSPGRVGKYGALENKKKLSRRDLLEHQQQLEHGAIGATDVGADTKTLESGKSDYGKLSAAHVLIRRKLKERKRFDSADYAMEKQGQPTDVPADLAACPAAPGMAASRYGTLGLAQTTINQQVKHIKLSESPKGRLASPVVANAAQAALAARAARYAGLKGSRNENTIADTNASHAAFDRYGLDKTAAPSTAAAARNLVLQRKLAERKIFDSADHFKKAA